MNQLWAIIVTLFFSFSLYAKTTRVPTLNVGTSSSGGGYVVVCRDQEKIISVDLLDLYESKYAYNLNLWTEDLVSKPSPLDFINLAKNKINQTLGKEAESLIYF